MNCGQAWKILMEIFLCKRTSITNMTFWCGNISLCGSFVKPLWLDKAPGERDVATLKCQLYLWPVAWLCDHPWEGQHYFQSIINKIQEEHWTCRGHEALKNGRQSNSIQGNRGWFQFFHQYWGNLIPSMDVPWCWWRTCGFKELVLSYHPLDQSWLPPIPWNCMTLYGFSSPSSMY